MATLPADVGKPDPTLLAACECLMTKPWSRFDLNGENRLIKFYRFYFPYTTLIILVKCGGRTRTRTLDPLIKRLQRALDGAIDFYKPSTKGHSREQRVMSEVQTNIGRGAFILPLTADSQLVAL
jgi:hypothetical protein